MLRINVNANSLTGPLPTSWSTLQFLNEYSIHSNHITGSIPNIYGNLSSLSLIDFGSNHLTGTLPSEIFQLKEPVLTASFFSPPQSLPPFQTGHDRLRSTLMSESHLLNIASYSAEDFIMILRDNIYHLSEVPTTLTSVNNQSINPIEQSIFFVMLFLHKIV